MSTAKWSPQIARAMHELSNAAPAAPTAAYLRDHSPTRPNERHVATTGIAALIVVAAAVGLAVVMSRDDNTRVSSPAPVLDVQHSQTMVVIDAQLECDVQIDTTGTYSYMVIDSYSDRIGRQWRTVITYPDGSTSDFIGKGSAIYPTARFQRGEDRGSRLGCIGPADEEFALVSAPGPGQFFALNLYDELTTDELPFVLGFKERSFLKEGQHNDSRGRPSELWVYHNEGGTAGYGSVATFDVVQTSSWWVDISDGNTVTEFRFSNTVDTLGSGSEQFTLVASDVITVPADFFDAEGFEALETFPRPSLNGSSSDDTIVAASPDTQSTVVPDEQRDTFADGIVTTDEYHMAFARFRGCAQEQGGSVTLYGTDQTTGAIQYGTAGKLLPVGQLGGSAENECYQTYFALTELGFRTTNPGVLADNAEQMQFFDAYIRPCLESIGVEVPTDLVVASEDWTRMLDENTKAHREGKC